MLCLLIVVGIRRRQISIISAILRLLRISFFEPLRRKDGKIRKGIAECLRETYRLRVFAVQRSFPPFLCAPSNFKKMIMKYILFISLTLLHVTSFAQKESFDVISYALPTDSAGLTWKKEVTENITSYTIINKTNWCRINVVK